MDYQKEQIIKIAEYLHKDIWSLAAEIGSHPEEGYKEYYATKVLVGFLRKHGFQVSCPLAGMDTAFKAGFQGQQGGARVIYLAEYDALPEIGHGCGHNLIGAAGVGAAVVLSKMEDLAGEVVVIGSPAEETSGAKVTLTEAGLFDQASAALMFHPGSCNVAEIASLALDAIEVVYHGKSAHMAVADSGGINALEALLDLFNRIEKLRRKLGRAERIDGIIVEGGKSPNIVPDKAVARFYLRAAKRERLNQIRQKFLECAYKAADKVHAKLEWRYYEFSYDEMVTNYHLAHTFRTNLRYLGITDIEPAQTMVGSVDMGNVSQVVPALHAYLRLGNGTEVPHTVEFAQAVLSEAGERVLATAVKALALTGWDVLTNSELRQKMHQEMLQKKRYARSNFD